jgi:hypothetical protein
MNTYTKEENNLELSIIIVNWNGKEYLMECLGSLSEEMLDNNFEIIVVDNASTDGSPGLVQARFPNVKLIRNDNNMGFAKANNIGIRQSGGRYICLINSDIVVLRNCLRYMIDFMNKHTEIGILGPKIYNPDRTLQPSCMGFPTLWNMFCRALALDTFMPKSRLFGRRLMSFWAHDSIRSVEVLNGCFLMVRRDALDKVGLLDENFFFYGEDIDWCKRFRDQGWDVVFLPDVKAIHYGGASSSRASVRFYIELERAALQYWRKHHSPLAQKSFLLITCLHQVLRIIGQSSMYIIYPSKRKEVLPKIKRSVACIQWLMKIDEPQSYYDD